MPVQIGGAPVSIEEIQQILGEKELVIYILNRQLMAAQMRIGELENASSIRTGNDGSKISGQNGSDAATDGPSEGPRNNEATPWDGASPPDESKEEARKFTGLSDGPGGPS